MPNALNDHASLSCWGTGNTQPRIYILTMLQRYYLYQLSTIYELRVHPSTTSWIECSTPDLWRRYQYCRWLSSDWQNVTSAKCLVNRIKYKLTVLPYFGSNLFIFRYSSSSSHSVPFLSSVIQRFWHSAPHFLLQICNGSRSMHHLEMRDGTCPLICEHLSR